MADHTGPGEQDMDAARGLLDRVPALRHPCDLDLLVFFARHWQTLLSSEQLARLLGYPLAEIARSRDAFVAAGLLRRVKDPTRPERMYVLERERMADGPFTAIVTLASTPRGRVLLRRTLRSASVRDADATPAELRPERATPRQLRPPVDGASPKRNRTQDRPSTGQPGRTQ